MIVKDVMRREAVIIILLVLLALVPLFSCKMFKKTDRYSLWRGDIENWYYILDMNEQRLQKVVGKPYMIFEYDPLTGYPLQVEFGLYEARNEYLPGCEGGIPEPTLSADQLRYSRRLGITGSVVLLLNWAEVTSSCKLPSGDFEFFIDKGPDFFGHETLHFTYTPSAMDGEIRNGTATWGGRVSEPKAFKLLHLFNSNTYY